MRPPPDFAEAAHRRRYIFKSGPHVRKESWFVKQFASPVTAFLTLFALINAALLPYILLHVHRAADNFDVKGAIHISRDGTFTPFLITGQLERYYPQAEIVGLEQRLQEKAKTYRAQALEWRRAVFNDHTDKTTSRLASYIPAQVFGKKSAEITDSDLATADLNSLVQWFTNNSMTLDNGLRSEAERLVRALSAVNEREEELRLRLKEESAALEPALPFRWLFTDRAWWALEVVVWSFLGVLASSIITLIKACRQSAYSPSSFVLVFPKIFLAPVLAFIVVVFLCTGISKSPISLANLPSFLVISFFLGFVTEALYDKLNKLADTLIKSTTEVDEDKLRESALNQPYRYKNPEISPSELSAARNLDELRAQLNSAIKARLERSIVASSAVNEHSPV